MGNLRSVSNALTYLGYQPLISSQPHILTQADALILPGVGAFGEAMRNLKALGLVEVLTRQVLQEKKLFFGICLGMQLLAEESEELGRHQGLGWVKGRVVKIPAQRQLRLPHVGWNNIRVKRQKPLFANLEASPSYYFDHSFHLVCDQALVAATCQYGTELVAAVQWRNIFATQFHPEKSQVKGLKLLRNFLNCLEMSSSLSLAQEAA
jgi:glutamine amidotransferase